MTRSHKDLLAYIGVLENAGKLRRITMPINKDTELHPLVRLQFRGLEEKDRTAFLFENVTDSTGREYDIPVLIAAMAGSADIYALGMGCTIEEIPDVWNQALDNPLDPVVVDAGPCQEVVIEGKRMESEGLGLLPVPISTPGFDNAPYTSGSHWVTKDPHTGMHNLGNYRGMIKAPNRIGSLPGMLGVGMRRHIDMWREMGEVRLPAAIVIGAPPHVTYTAVTRVPNDMCEYDVAGGLSGAPLEMVRCLSHDLLVPAQAEIVIEGWVPSAELEMEGAFGEFPGYMAKRDYSFFMDVERITMRKNPVYLALISQLPPSESSKMRHIGRAAASKRLLLEAGFDNVLEVHYLECTGSNASLVVKFKDPKPGQGLEALKLIAGRFIGKIAIAVDDDIDIHSLEHVLWAIAWRAQPHRDIEIMDTPLLALDPSIAPPDQSRGLTDAANRPRNSGLLIDATMKWPYPPLSMPKKEYMERACEIWKELQFPKLDLKNPWYGYSLGHWTEEEEVEADLAVHGKHYETGEKMRRMRKMMKD